MNLLDILEQKVSAPPHSYNQIGYSVNGENKYKLTK